MALSRPFPLPFSGTLTLLPRPAGRKRVFPLASREPLRDIEGAGDLSTTLSLSCGSTEWGHTLSNAFLFAPVPAILSGIRDRFGAISSIRERRRETDSTFSLRFRRRGEAKRWAR